MLSSLLKNGISIGSAAGSFGIGAAKSAISSPLGGMAKKGIAKLGIGYGVIQASSSLADYADQANEMGAQIGGFYTGALKTAGLLGGGGMMLGTAVRGIGRAAGLGYSHLNREAISAGFSRRTDAISSFSAKIKARKKSVIDQATSGYSSQIDDAVLKYNPDNARSMSYKIRKLKDQSASAAKKARKSLGKEDNALAMSSRRMARTKNSYEQAMLGSMSDIKQFHNAGGMAEKVISGMQNFSSLKSGGKLSMLGLKGAKAVGRGLALSPVTVGADIGGTAALIGGKGNRVSKALYSLGNKRMGARMFGWGAMAGGGKLAFDAYQPIDEAQQSLAARNLALSGQQMYVPTNGRGPRRMDPNATAGITQSLHRLR